MEKRFRLEFNEKQQHFHLDNHTHKENTHDWITVFEECTNIEFHIFQAFLNRIPKTKLTKEYVLESATQCKAFQKKLVEKRLTINYSYNMENAESIDLNSDGADWRNTN